MIWPHTRSTSDNLFCDIHTYSHHIERNSPWLHCSRSLGKRSLWKAVSESFRYDIKQGKLQRVNRPISDLHFNYIMTYNSYYSIYILNYKCSFGKVGVINVMWKNSCLCLMKDVSGLTQAETAPTVTWLWTCGSGWAVIAWITSSTSVYLQNNHTMSCKKKKKCI